MSVGGGGSTGSSSGTQAPWAPQQPYILQGFQKAQSELLNNPAQYYPGSTVTPLGTGTVHGLESLENTALNSTLPGDASRSTSSTLNGGYLKSPQDWASQTYNPNANVMAGMAANQNANVTSGLATNANMNASNPNAGAWNPNAGVKADVGPNPFGGVKGDVGFNPYLNQGMNDYIGNVTNAVSRSVIPQVQSGFAGAGRTGESPLAQTAMAKGIADAVAPYQFNSAEAEMGRRFSGGESLASRAQSSSENQMQRLYGAGADYAGRAQTASENQAGRLYGAGSTLAGQLYGSGESQAQRQFAGGESEAARMQGISDALANRQYTSGENLAGAQRGEASAQAARQYGAGESSLTRGMSAYDAERNRQISAAGMAPELTAASFMPAQQMIAANAPVDQKAQEYLQGDVNRFNFGQTSQDDAIRQYMDVIQNNLGSITKGAQSGANFGVKTGK